LPSKVTKTGLSNLVKKIMEYSSTWRYNSNQHVGLGNIIILTLSNGQQGQNTPVVGRNRVLNSNI